VSTDVSYVKVVSVLIRWGNLTGLVLSGLKTSMRSKVTGRVQSNLHIHLRMTSNVTFTHNTFLIKLSNSVQHTFSVFFFFTYDSVDMLTGPVISTSLSMKTVVKCAVINIVFCIM